MTYDLLEQKVIKVTQEPENFKEYSVSSIDPKLQGILEKYKTQFDNVFSEEIFTASSNFDFKTSNSSLLKVSKYLIVFVYSVSKTKSSISKNIILLFIHKVRLFLLVRKL